MKFLKVLRIILRRILMITFCVIALTVANIFAYTESNIEETKDSFIYTYEISEEEEIDFLNSLEQTITKDKINATLVDKNKSGGDKVYTTERSKTESIMLDNNSTEYILSKIPQEYNYTSEDAFSGTLILDTTSISINEIKGATHEYKVSLTRVYENYNRNDLDTIPKTIQEKGITYYLTQPSWNVPSTEIIDNTEVPLTYSANMLYEGIAYRTDPSKYEITYTYKGNVEKVEENPIVYKITYEKEKTLGIIPAIIGGSCLFFVVIILFIGKKRISIYNKQDGDYILIKKINIKNKTIDLNKYNHLIVSVNFKIELDNKAFNKFKDTNITVKYNNISKTVKISKNSVLVGF